MHEPKTYPDLHKSALADPTSLTRVPRDRQAPIFHLAFAATAQAIETDGLPATAGELARVSVPSGPAYPSDHRALLPPTAGRVPTQLCVPCAEMLPYRAGVRTTKTVP